MNVQPRKILSVIGFIFIGVIIGGITGAYIMANLLARVDEGNLAIEQSAEITRNLNVLQQIRSGESDKASESIETALDGNLVFFSLDRKLDKKIETVAVMSLRRASEYRAKYPRTTKVREIDEALNKALSRLNANEK